MAKTTDAKTKKKILVVEDDPFLSDIYCTKLKETDFDIELAVTGEECLQKLKDKKFDLMILDIVLPKVDGWEILSRVKESREKGDNKNLEDMKIVILSNLGQKEEIQKGLRLGANGFLIKAHFTPSQIVEEIQKTIE